MTAVEIVLVLGLCMGTILGMAALGYLVVVLPMQEQIKDLQEKSKQTNFHQMRMQPELVAPRPKNVLPQIEDIPESAWDIGNYGEDHTTPEEAEEQMSDMELSLREADQSWQDLEELKHGKSQPIIYSGG